MYLGLDIGTSSLKALLTDDDQKLVATVSVPLEISRPKRGWSEQNPSDWIGAAETALHQLSTKNEQKFSGVRGIGLSGQMHGATLLNDADEVLRPSILWNDTRSHAEAAELDAIPIFREISGNIVFPGFTAPKLLWVMRHEPELFSKVKKVLLPKDYLRLWLTGEHVSDMSDSAGTSWLDTGRRDWSDELLDHCGLERRHMPRLVEGTEVSGLMRNDLAQRWGFKENVVVAGGAGDNAASAVGLGAVQAGSAFLSLGTSGVLFAANDSYRPNPKSAVHTFCHALPQTWHQMGVILSASDALEWFAGISGEAPGALVSEIGDDLRSPGESVFLPYLSGERTPHNDAEIRGAFAGLSRGTDRGAITRAILEGVTFALRDNLEALREAGTVLNRVMAVGGGSRSRYWLKAIATTLDVTIDIPAEGEFGAAFGAARLGQIAATGADATRISSMPSIAETIEPVRELTGAFEDGWRRFRDLYPALSGARS